MNPILSPGPVGQCVKAIPRFVGKKLWGRRLPSFISFSPFQTSHSCSSSSFLSKNSCSSHTSRIPAIITRDRSPPLLSSLLICQASIPPPPSSRKRELSPPTIYLPVPHPSVQSINHTYIHNSHIFRARNQISFFFLYMHPPLPPCPSPVTRDHCHCHQ